ncbi:hypothetical protein EUTSA_v10005232mg [Eutrema salsugineum]|uniref:Uncharacterized protein n=1 Tax=Eutrema salsugineum TaxID=72664 RepID=V4MLL9_EUTSA|nr:hypothetical protein EUTSA_v10005232mg [Eutrema salsugineum]
MSKKEQHTTIKLSLSLSFPQIPDCLLAKIAKSSFYSSFPASTIFFSRDSASVLSDYVNILPDSTHLASDSISVLER